MAKSVKLHDLQALRALAAALVVTDHAIIRYQPDAYQPLAWYLGFLGVAVFFVISGFIMAFTTAGQSGGPAAGAFMLKRLARIAPLYWAATLAAMILHHADAAKTDVGHVAAALLFIPYSTPDGPIRPILGQGWTLDLEIMFYALFALALLAPKRWKIAGLVAALTAMVACGALLKPLTDTADPTSVLTFISQPLILLFALGMVLGLVRVRIGPGRISHGLATATAVLLGAGVVFAWARGGSPFSLNLGLLGWSAATAAVCLCVFSTNGISGRTSRLMERGGDASYSVYLLHPFLVDQARHLLPHPSPPHMLIIFIAICLIAAFAGGWVVHVMLERPVTRWLTGRIVDRTVERAPSPAAVVESVRRL